MKRLSNFFYLVSQGVKSVFKNAVMSVASLLTLLCCLLVLGSFYMIIDNIGENAKMTDKLNQLVVTLDKSLTDEQIESVKQSVDKLDNILSWTYKSCRCATWWFLAAWVRARRWLHCKRAWIFLPPRPAA